MVDISTPYGVLILVNQIMVELNLKIHPKQRLAYIPRQIVNELGTSLKIISGARAFVAYPEGEPPAVILRSLEVIIKDLELRRDLRARA